jgi:predicted metal-dependent phosphoesterase TrpH
MRRPAGHQQLVQLMAGTGIVIVLPLAAVVAVAGIEIRIVEEVCGQNIQDAARLAHKIGAKTAQTRLDPIQLANRYAEVVGEFFGRSSHIFTPGAKTAPDNFVNSRHHMPTATSIRTLNSRPGERAIRNACEH